MMSKFFERYDAIGAIAGAKAFKSDIDKIEAAAEDAWTNSFKEEDATEENLNMAIVAAVLQLLRKMTPECGSLKDRGYIIYEAAQNIKIAEDYEDEL